MVIRQLVGLLIGFVWPGRFDAIPPDLRSFSRAAMVPGCVSILANGRRILGALCSGLLLASLVPTASAAEVVLSPQLSIKMSRDSGPRDVVYGFFHEDTGERVAHLHIELVTLDYRRQGVFRVAWKPQVVLNRARLHIADSAAWPAVSGQLANALRRLSGRATLVLREFTIETEGPEGGRVEAPLAELTPEGNLLLHDARRAGSTGQPASLLLRLSGPDTGEVVPVEAPPARPDVSR